MDGSDIEIRGYSRDFLVSTVVTGALLTGDRTNMASSVRMGIRFVEFATGSTTPT